jgi:pseudouridine-5'-phosphate glycosidase
VSAYAPIQVREDVAEAIGLGRPVVALETALVAHGFPSPMGADVGREAEARIRAAGAVPATIGVVAGTIRVGLGDDELDLLARSADVRKLGARDLAACCVAGATGATTVGGTLAVCRAVGIRFLATGGIGGVHRGFAERPDVSADLAELARTQALVVSSGVKSLLDVRATIEILESLSIPVLGWRTATLPLFLTAAGGPPVTDRVETPEQAADVARVHWALEPRRAILLARPPDEGLAGTELEALFRSALQDADEAEVGGQDVTPFVLARVHERSGGRTREVNRRLISDNASLTAQIASAHARAG